MTLNSPAPFQVLRSIHLLFEGLGVRYFVGGSLASGLRGIFRATIDIDVIAFFDSEMQVQEFCNKAQSEFYADEESAPNCFLAGQTFNIIHQKSFIKVDIFTRTGDFEKSQLSRATNVQVPGMDFAIPVASREDMILAKLRWYVSGDRTSDRQWQDLLGLIQVGAENLDEAYLTQWSTVLGVEKDLNRLLTSVQET